MEIISSHITGWGTWLYFSLPNITSPILYYIGMESHRREFQNKLEQTVPFFIKRNRVEPDVEKNLKKKELILTPVNLPVTIMEA